jgi:hypothetical protein
MRVCAHGTPRLWQEFHANPRLGKEPGVGTGPLDIARRCGHDEITAMLEASLAKTY